MKLSIDSNDLPAATRLATWRGLLCDTFIGMDCRFAGDDFRSSIKGHSVGAHTITRIRSTHHVVDRSRTLIKRDGLDMAFFGIPLAGRAVVEQGGRETALERGSIVINDSSRPFRTQVDRGADIIWVSLPKAAAVDRIRAFEDLVCVPIVPGRPLVPIALGILAGLDAALADEARAPGEDALVAQFVDLLAMTIMSGGLFPARTYGVGGWSRDGSSDVAEP